ncbi:helix-turn-helix domain-containing protein [Weissella ceti]|uniref:Helix-turn-helix domain-containing protein n=1 Tax=Weissella ceti TaxID=759620 RepID=A0ABT3E4D4_9LACO|nr:helix-turn-helix transcriptional regulator [Weissella ceti]MCW0953281.1 helix-turn-helix domain-containing protein [Weissella ceti]QVK11390.1 helix-turn-helix transcriptional regulator [Weissella ceti]
MSVFNNVKQTAKNKGLSIEQLADKLAEYSEINGVKVSKSTIYTWKTKEPSAEKIKAVADVLGVSVNYLMDADDTMTSRPTNEEIDFKESLDKAIAYNGKPLSDHDKAVILSFMATLKAEDK